MKLRILTLLFIFTCIASSTYAVIDVKEHQPTERTQNFQKESFSKSKKVKKRKFRLRDLFQWKKKIKKVRKEKKTKFYSIAGWSLFFAILGTLAIFLFRAAPLFTVAVVIISELLALILGVIGLTNLKKRPEELHGKTAAIVGIIISSLWVILMGVFLIWLFCCFGS